MLCCCCSSGGSSCAPYSNSRYSINAVFDIYIRNWLTPPTPRSSIISSDGDDKGKKIFCLFCQLI